MNKRLGFIVIASALAFGVGCDDDGSEDAGPIIVLDDGGDSGPGDAGPGEDAGPLICNSVGRSGGLCREGTQCLTGLTCVQELSIMGMPITLGNAFGIQDGMLDPMAVLPEYIPTGDSTVPLNMVPGGLCSEGCSTEAMTDTCGECSFCNEDIGGSGSFGAVGITIRTFNANWMVVGAGEDGICRARCDYQPGTAGGCPDGYTCDRFTNTCLESCVSDSQCNLSWGNSRQEGLVAIQAEGTPFTCNTTNGQCEWTAPPTAAFGAECDSSADCAAGTGLCYFGRCSETNCVNSTNDGMGPGTCPADGVGCFGSGGNNASFCLPLCNTADDCDSVYACSPLMTPIMDQMGTTWPGVCVGPCEGNTECQASRRCDNTFQRFANEDLGICNEFCDPMGMGLMDAVTCDTTLGEVCEQVEGENYGFCVPQNQLCGSNEPCNAGQRCRQVSNDGLGRCEASCAVNADCNVAMGEECVIVDTDPDDMFTEDRGVCIAPDGPCSPSGVSTVTGQAFNPLRGATGDFQCISTQECDAPQMMGMDEVDSVGTCVDRP